MRVRCPNCPAVIVEFTQLLDPGNVATVRCANCGVFLSQFWDELGVTYTSHYLTNIQEMRDESKAAKRRVKSLASARSKRSRGRKSPEIGEANPGNQELPKPSTGSFQ